MLLSPNMQGRLNSQFDETRENKPAKNLVQYTKSFSFPEYLFIMSVRTSRPPALTNSAALLAQSLLVGEIFYNTCKQVEKTQKSAIQMQAHKIIKHIGEGTCLYKRVQRVFDQLSELCLLLERGYQSANSCFFL